MAQSFGPSGMVEKRGLIKGKYIVTAKRKVDIIAAGKMSGFPLFLEDLVFPVFRSVIRLNTLLRTSCEKAIVLAFSTGQSPSFKPTV